MTGLNFYDTYITSWLKILATLDGFLTKAEAHAKETGKDADKDYIGARIIDDMLPLTFQIQTVTNMMKMPIKILTDRPAEEWANEEKTFAELHARIAKAVELLKSVKPEEMNGREEELVKVYVASSYKSFLPLYITNSAPVFGRAL